LETTTIIIHGLDAVCLGDFARPCSFTKLQLSEHAFLNRSNMGICARNHLIISPAKSYESACNGPVLGYYPMKALILSPGGKFRKTPGWVFGFVRCLAALWSVFRQAPPLLLCCTTGSGDTSLHSGIAREMA
jgi:hypothetical protein